MEVKRVTGDGDDDDDGDGGEEGRREGKKLP